MIPRERLVVALDADDRNLPHELVGHGAHEVEQGQYKIAVGLRICGIHE
jgi:hypothetical protein